MSYYGNFVRAHLADDLPRLENYREAQLWFQAVKPFSKGKSAGQKPLGRNRRYDRFKIRGEYLNNAFSDQSITIKHYSTDILRYNADGSLILNSGGYDSISTTQGLQEILGADKFVRRKCKVYFKDSNDKYYRIKEGLRVNADSTANEEGLVNEVIHEIDRPAFKQIRERYKDFMEYVLLSNNLTQGGEGMASTLALEGVENGEGKNTFYRKNASVALSIDTTQIRWYRNPQFAVRDVFFSEVERAMQLEGEDKYKAYHHLGTFLSFSASTDFYGTSWVQSGDDRKYQWRVDNKRLKQFFDGLLKFRFPSLIFKKTEVPLGVIRHDTNAKYFEFGTV